MTDARWLPPAAAALYLGVGEARLRALVRAGRIKPPSYHLGPRTPRYDRQALDAALAGGVSSADPEVASSRAVEAILTAPPRARRQAASR